MILLEKLEFNG